MGRKKLQNLEKVEIGAMASEGKCVAKVDGQVIFVSNVAPGDIADLRITANKKKYLEAAPTTFYKKSEVRVEPKCSHFGTCGGCKWQHINYETQLKYKRQQVVDSLERIAKVELPEIEEIVPASKTEFYRNKLEFTFSNKRWFTKEEIDTEGEIERRGLGFHMPGRFDKLLDINKCFLQDEPSNPIRQSVREYSYKNDISFYDLRNHTGLLRNLIIRTSSTGQVMIIVQASERNDKLDGLLEHLRESFPDITSLNYVINSKANETFHDLEVVNFSGQPYITESMPRQNGANLEFRIGPKSFYQTNSDQAYELYKVARDFADLTGKEMVYDLYTGTGTIANFVADQSAKVVGIEYVEDAIKDAEINSKENNINNTAFFAGDMKNVLNESFLNKHGQPDVIICDPPRAGMHPDVIKMLLRIGAEKIVYVSCNPGTQARDLIELDSRYKVTRVKPVDMFPHTHHVENVVKLELRK